MVLVEKTKTNYSLTKQRKVAYGISITELVHFIALLTY